MHIRSLTFALWSSAGCAQAQTVLDAPFIAQRWALNASSDAVERAGGDSRFVRRNAAAMGDHALSEPFYWTERRCFRIVLAEVPALQVVDVAGSDHPFITALRAAQDRVTPFRDADFDHPATDHVELPDPVALLLKVDFAYNDTAHALRPYFIGLGLQGADSTVVWCYYPELRYVLREFQVRTPEGAMPCSTFLEEWHMVVHPVPQERTFGAPYTTGACREQGELDALIQLFLIEREIAVRGVIRRGRRAVKLSGCSPQPQGCSVEFGEQGRLQRITLKRGGAAVLTANYTDGVPHGPFRMFRRDGGLLEQGQFEHGLREGPWTSWYENGNIRARRNYTHGGLDGKQRAYFDNGQLKLEYDMANGDYEGVHQAFYSDGHLHAAGRMHEGFVVGEWTYAQWISDSLRTYMTAHPGQFDLAPAAWQDHYLEYRVTYTPLPPSDQCLLRRCYDFQWSMIE